MAYDGFAVAATVRELNDRLLMGSISKVAQPEKDELLLSIKNNRQIQRLLISADPSLPLLRLREDNELSQAAAPSFCMSLRKHIGGGRIMRIYQPGRDLEHEGLERIVVFEIEHLDELGDLSRKRLVCELMGKYSNIILLREDGTILDSIKHVGMLTSSVREVLPGRDYFIPDQSHKEDPVGLLSEGGRKRFSDRLTSSGNSLRKAIYMDFTGFSPVMAEELCFRAGLDSDRYTLELSSDEQDCLYEAFLSMMEPVSTGSFEPNIIYEGDAPVEFSAIPLHHMEGGTYESRGFSSMSEVISLYYEERAKRGRIRSKSEDIRHTLRQLTERCAKKLELQEKQFADAAKLDRYRIYGELINTYGYGLSGGEKELRCQNYYDEGREIVIPLDDRLSARDNAKRYFDRYQKLKRTREALTGQIEESRQRLWHLDSLTQALSMAETEGDLNAIRQEMREYGYISSHAEKGRQRKQELRSEPMHFVSSDGIEIYVGRNNYQNEELSFRLSDPSDWWFHAKGVAGSHVIARTGQRELPDATCLEAAALAAYYSRAGSEDKVEVDYVQRKELRRVPKAAPGYVIYHTNYSIVIEPRAKI